MTLTKDSQDCSSTFTAVKGTIKTCSFFSVTMTTFACIQENIFCVDFATKIFTSYLVIPSLS